METQYLRRFLVPTSLFFLVAAASVIFIHPWGNFPLNDDWVYTKNVIDTFSNGHFTARFAQYAWAIPQTFLGVALYPLNKENPFAVLRLIGILSGIAGALAMVWICFRATPKKNPILIWLSICSTFFFAPYFLTTFSFMTDVPALLLWTLSLATLAGYLENRTAVTLGVAIATNALAFSQRQHAALIPFSIGIAQTLELDFKNLAVSIRGYLKKSIPLLLFLIPMFLIWQWWNHVYKLRFDYVSFHIGTLFFTVLHATSST